jgi:hypothetical protein
MGALAAFGCTAAPPPTGATAAAISVPTTYVYDRASAGKFADDNWNCFDYTCSSRVSEGSWQDSYVCAEFASRVLAAGGAIDFNPYGPLPNFTYKGVGYDLQWVSSQKGILQINNGSGNGTLGVQDYLEATGQWTALTNVGYADLEKGDVVIMTGDHGPESHVGIAIGPNSVDAHNAAHYHASYVDPINVVYRSKAKPYPLGMLEVAAHARNAGVGCGDVATAAAIAAAASGNDVRAFSWVPIGTTDKGLWQINSSRQLPELYDDNGNARAMFTVSMDGTQWWPWPEYTGGAYRGFLASAQTAADQVCGPTTAHLPASPTECGKILPGQGLTRGDAVYACNGAFHLVLQGDGNLVLYGDVCTGAGHSCWATGTYGSDGGYVADMQGDGNFVVYTPQSAPIWHSDTAGHSGAYLAVQDDGNLVLYDDSCTGANHSCWASGTSH